MDSLVDTLLLMTMQAAMLLSPVNSRKTNLIILAATRESSKRW